jgi:hypothetical protein
MAGLLWVSDREPGVRQLFGELLPEAEVLRPDELDARIALGQRPDGLVIDGTQLLELPARRRSALLTLPRVLVCTGMLLASMPMRIVSGPNVAVLAKPFCVDDLEAAIEWLRGAADGPLHVPDGVDAVLRRPRSRHARPTLPAN